jgi:predicted nucleotidyltransferase
MLSERDKKVILTYAKKYKVKKVILFGSSIDRTDARDIDIGVKGLAPELFFRFCGELYRDLSKPVDVIDLSEDCLFNKLIERDGLVLYG